MGGRLHSFRRYWLEIKDQPQRLICVWEDVDRAMCTLSLKPVPEKNPADAESWATVVGT